MPQKDYYKILGVDKNASQDQIKSAYRKMAKQYHPDLHPGDNAAAEKFKEVNEAYSVVGDPDKRGKYDRGEMDMDGAGGFNPFGGGGGFSGGLPGGANAAGHGFAGGCGYAAGFLAKAAAGYATVTGAGLVAKGGWAFGLFSQF